MANAATSTASLREYDLEKVSHKTKAKSRWFSLEFFFYYFILLFAIYKVVLSGWKMSSPAGNPNFSLLKPLLSQGWMASYVDNSDAQFSGFRNNILELTLLMCIFCLLSLILKFLKKESYLFLAGMAVLLALHGLYSVFVIFFMMVNYSMTFLGQKYSPKLIPILTWSWALLSLISLEQIGHQISFANISWGYLTFLDGDIFKGGYKRWWVIYNLSVLRMISFNMDYYYALVDSKAIASPGGSLVDLVFWPFFSHARNTFVPAMSARSPALLAKRFVQGPILHWEHITSTATFLICFMLHSFWPAPLLPSITFIPN